MEKATADAILERDTGPIEPHLAALASEHDLPSYAVGMCALRIEEAAPALHAVLAKAADGATLSEAEARQLLRGVFILGGGRHAGAFPTFVRFLRRPEAELVELLGDALEIGLPKIMSGMFDGDADALLALVRDPTCIDDVKLSAMEAAAFLTFDGRIDRERMRAFLADFAGAPAEKGDLIWVTWAAATAKLGLRDLVPLVEAAFADGRVTQATMRRKQFDKELAEAEAAPKDASRFEDASYIADTLEALEWTRAGEGWSRDVSVVADVDAPIEVHLAALSRTRLPQVALRVCVARFAEAAPRLRALLARAASGLDLSDDESLQCFRGLHVLAAVRDQASFPPFTRFLRRPLDEVEVHLGDAITENLSRLLISLFDGDEELLLAVVGDPTLDEYVRGGALEAATYLTWEGRIGRERLHRFLIDFHARRLAEEEDFVWYSWMQAIALLDLGDLVPRVEAAWKAGWIDHSFLDWNDFKMDLARARTAWDDADRFRSVGYVDDVVAELAWTDHSDDKDADAATAWKPPPDVPVINPFRNVGRNDPCPCGSGKKYKKCCLAT